MARTRHGLPGIYNATPLSLTDQEGAALALNSAGVALISMSDSFAGEDLTNDVLKTEQRFSYSLVAADAAVKNGSGFLHALTFSQNDAAPTAGTIIFYDNIAESGTQIFNWTLTTAVFMPFTVIIDATFGTGLYAGFTTTADVNVTVSYR